nr:hypothetical protein Iba_chr11aCG14810 [Ipomoea batatas]GMD52758.1 hypothetical protein Iba_chr11bCG14710 [Ipomoea batatas]
MNMIFDCSLPEEDRLLTVVPPLYLANTAIIINITPSVPRHHRFAVGHRRSCLAEKNGVVGTPRLRPKSSTAVVWLKPRSRFMCFEVEERRCD